VCKLGKQVTFAYPDGLTIFAHEKPMIIAVDGPSAAGKGTIARAIAKKFRYHFLDTGSLYRMVGAQVLRDGLSVSDEEAVEAVALALRPELYADRDLRNEWVATAASKASILPKVRAALLAMQRDFARRQPGAVLDGRDIGTVVCPEADVKLFITASSEIRAARRHKELLEQGSDASFAEILADVQSRDQRDQSRTHSPLLPAADAITLDTTTLTAEEAVVQAISIVKAAKH
jgi:cytidylate kinase